MNVVTGSEIMVLPLSKHFIVVKYMPLGILSVQFDGIRYIHRIVCNHRHNLSP
jgi:hypothetical protein